MEALRATAGVMQRGSQNLRTAYNGRSHRQCPGFGQVTAGTVVFEAPITVRASSTGGGSTLAGIGRLVAVAQAREAPVQRLADTIAGRFCFSVMAVSAATFAFWSTLGALANTVSLVSEHMHCPCAALQGVCICLFIPNFIPIFQIWNAGLLLPSLFAVC